MTLTNILNLLSIKDFFMIIVPCVMLISIYGKNANINVLVITLVFTMIFYGYIKNTNFSFVNYGIIIFIYCSYLYIYIMNKYKIDISIKGFFCTISVFFYFITYFISIYSFFIFTPQIILLKDLTVVSILRYHIILLMCILIIFIFILQKNIIFIKKLVGNKISPIQHIYENLRIIVINAMPNVIVANAVTYVVDNLYLKSYSKYTYTLLKFSCVIIPAIIRTILLLNFVYFNGNLCILLYMFPLVLISSTFNFLEYVLKKTLEDDLKDLNKLIKISPKYQKNVHFDSTNNFMIAIPSDFDVYLTQEALQEGYNNKKVLLSIFLKVEHSLAILTMSNKCIIYPSIIIFIVNILAYYGIIKNFYINKEVFMVIPFVSNVFKHTTKALHTTYSRGYATSVFRVRQQYSQQIKTETDGTYDIIT